MGLCVGERKGVKEARVALALRLLVTVTVEDSVPVRHRLGLDEVLPLAEAESDAVCGEAVPVRQLVGEADAVSDRVARGLLEVQPDTEALAVVEREKLLEALCEGDTEPRGLLLGVRLARLALVQGEGVTEDLRVALGVGDSVPEGLPVAQDETEGQLL